MVARQLTAATHFPGQLSCKASGHGRAMLAPTRVFASLGSKYSCPPHGSLPHRLRVPPAQRGPREGGAPRGVFSLWPKTRSVGAHSICARGGLSCRKRARADMESAPTVLWRAPPRREGQERGAFLPVVRASGFILLYFIIRNLQKNDRLSLNTNRRFCRYFSGFVPKKCPDTSSWIFGCRSACAPQQNPAH